MKPTVGRIVHYQVPGEAYPRAAIVTYVWSETCVNLWLAPNGVDLLPAGGVVTSAEFSEQLAPGRWTWPPRV